VVPIVHSVKVCTPTGTPDCRGPCYQCDEYCEPASQSWCEKTHTISTLVSDIRSDDRNILLRREKDEVKTSENCYEKEVELCGPSNCKFVNVSMECHEKNNTMEVELRERECVVCEPTLAEKVNVEEKCDQVYAKDCETDPLSRPWKKFCSEEGNNAPIESTRFQFDEVEEPRALEKPASTKFSVEDLINQSLGPVNNLVFETLKQIHVVDIDSSTPVIITKKPKEASNDDILEILKLIEMEKDEVKEEVTALKELQANPTTINVNVQFEPAEADFTREPKSSVYFDQILNTFNNEDVQKSAASTPKSTSPPSLTEVLQNQLQNQFQPPTQISSTSRASSKATASSEPTTFSTTTIKVQTTKTTNRPVTVTDLATTPHSNLMLNKKKLSPAEFLRLCFTSHQGCDFSQNEIEPVNAEIEEVTKPTTTPTTTATQIPIRRGSERDIQEKLKQRVKLCFFSGLCNDSDLQFGDIRASVTTTTTTTTQEPTTTRSPRNAAIQRRVLERARACFFEGKCN